MRRMFLPLWALTLSLHAVSYARISIGPAFSGGEIIKPYGYDMVETVGIYEYGASLSFEKKHLESSLQLEMGRYNRNQSFGIAADVNGKYGIFQEAVKLYAGFGFAYNAYVFDDWKGHNALVGEYKHDYSPYLTVKAEILQTVRIGFEPIFDSRIFWKARLGLMLFKIQ